VVGVLGGELACSLEVLQIEARPVGERTAEATTGDVEGKYDVAQGCHHGQGVWFSGGKRSDDTLMGQETGHRLDQGDSRPKLVPAQTPSMWPASHCCGTGEKQAEVPAAAARPRRRPGPRPWWTVAKGMCDVLLGSRIR
jgi:hypothetical protein